ncbi:hypothetical protein BASA81_012127 [Batrachochytrium salamandrivorans]|nr:hypothetical protein BASA81_012127 [Batrachochytrium salamandrivorans]
MGAVLQSERGQSTPTSLIECFGSDASNEQVYESTVRNLIPKGAMGINCHHFRVWEHGRGQDDTTPSWATAKTLDDAAQHDDCLRPSNPGGPAGLAFKSPTWKCTVKRLEICCPTLTSQLILCERASDGSVQCLVLRSATWLDVNEVLALVAEGSHRRKTEPTAANEVSSRSHAVLQVSVTKSTPNPNFKPLTQGVVGQELDSHRHGGGPFIKRSARLSLIDLAAGARCRAKQPNGNARVKYRDSKLTHILKSSLEGDCRVVMLAAINPSHKSYEESHNTLKYAYRAKNIKSSVTAISIAQQQAAAALKSFPEFAERDASSSGSLMSSEEEEDLFNEEDVAEEEEENAAPMLQAIRNVFFAPNQYQLQQAGKQLASPPPSQQPRSKVMKMTSKDSFEADGDDGEEEYQEEESLQDARSRVGGKPRAKAGARQGQRAYRFAATAKARNTAVHSPAQLADFHHRFPAGFGVQGPVATQTHARRRRASFRGAQAAAPQPGLATATARARPAALPGPPQRGQKAPPSRHALRQQRQVLARIACKHLNVAVQHRPLLNKMELIVVGPLEPALAYPDAWCQGHRLRFDLKRSELVWTLGTCKLVKRLGLSKPPSSAPIFAQFEGELCACAFLASNRILVCSQSGWEWEVALPFAAKKLWACCQGGVLVERFAHPSLVGEPFLFSISHPLEEAKPVLFEGGMQRKLQQVVWVSGRAEAPLALLCAVNDKSHTLWKVARPPLPPATTRQRDCESTMALESEGDDEIHPEIELSLVRKVEEFNLELDRCFLCHQAAGQLVLCAVLGGKVVGFGLGEEVGFEIPNVLDAAPWGQRNRARRAGFIGA